MSFFNEMGKKISSASQDAISKTKDFADVTKLNASIAEEERKIKAAYAEIGKAYFEAHPDDFEPSLEPQISLIKQCNANISEFKRQITTIKGVGICPNCGAEISKDAAFCSSCGNPVPKETKEDVVDSQVVSEEIVPTEAEVVEEKKCPKCGEKIEEGAVFCVNCGAKLDDI